MKNFGNLKIEAAEFVKCVEKLMELHVNRPMDGFTLYALSAGEKKKKDGIICLRKTDYE